MIDYLVGNYRYFCYTSVPFLLRKHIKEQYEWRLTQSNPKCLDNGECIMCGCKTPNLMMANRSCEDRCYPEMLNKKEWKELSWQTYIMNKYHKNSWR